MQTSMNSRRLNGERWVYATLRVHDGDRVLKPSHVSFDHVRFDEPPRLANSQIEIIVTNGEAVQRQMATVLPHDADDTRIPIQLSPQ